MGLHEGMNLFVDAEGRFRGESYIPAYLRRYPFLLARLRPDSEELSLCFDPSSGIISAEGEGDPLFSEGQPSETTRSEEHTSELQSLMRISYAVFCLKKKNKIKTGLII